ncbi:MAG TPA: alpha/beta fold hydrolase [Candidatus Acidoferrum sp.]|jgi:dipeptidyl aminopeptidase/acylaminoacyl peptidase
MRTHKSLCLSALLILLTANAFAQQLPSAITTDPPPDKTFPAIMEAPDIPSHGSRLNSVFYLASGSGPNPTALLLHGFPGNEKNMDLAYVLQRAGWNVLFPNYRGSWGSAGTFSFANAIEDTQSAVDFLREPANVKKYRIDPKRIVLIGHSMGGFMAAYVAAHDPQVSALVMICAWNIGPTVLRPADNGRSDNYKNSSPRLAGTTPEGLMSEAKNNALKWNYVDYAPLLNNRPVLILESNDRNRDDNHAMAEALRKAGNPQVTEKFTDTDHSFSGHRIALQIALLDWLQSLPAPSAK